MAGCDLAKCDLAECDLVECGLAEHGIVENTTSANLTHTIHTYTLKRVTLYARSRKTHTQALIRTIYTYAGRGVSETSIQVKCGRTSDYGRK